MSNYKVTVKWQRGDIDILQNKYSWGMSAFFGRTIIPTSVAPQIIPLPWSTEANVDPDGNYR